MKRAWLPPTMSVLAIVLIGAGLAVAQEPEPASIEYVGSQACAECHPAQHAYWANSLHARIAQDPAQFPDSPIILADFAAFSDVITDTRLKYTERDVILSIGWRYRQRYILRDARTRRLVLGAGQWNIAGQGPLAADNTWQSAPAGADWLDECAGCHTTGLDLAAAKAYRVGQALPFVELGVGCEACHGPGGEHVQAPSPSSIPVDRLEALDGNICAQCHTRGASPTVEGETHPYPIDYTPGDKLSDKNFVPVRPTGLITDTHWWRDGHAKSYAMQYQEWTSSRHAKALETLRKAAAPDSCLACHSADYAAITRLVQAGHTDVTTPTLKTASFAITCQACHAPHQPSTRPADALLRSESQALCTACHNATQQGKNPPKPGAAVHHPVQEMFEGTGAIGVEGQPSVHLPVAAAGAACTTCHMAGMATSADLGDIATHNWAIVMPAQADPGQPSSCSACHINPNSRLMQFTPDALQQIATARQEEIQDKLNALSKQLKDLKSAHPEWDPKAAVKSEQQSAYETAFTNVSFVESDGSLGIHNYEYAQAILDKAHEQLSYAGLPATSTPTSTPTPSATPTPTATPLPTPTATPIPPPSGGSSFGMWVLMAAVVAVVAALLFVRRPRVEQAQDTSE